MWGVKYNCFITQEHQRYYIAYVYHSMQCRSYLTHVMTCTEILLGLHAHDRYSLQPTLGDCHGEFTGTLALSHHRVIHTLHDIACISFMHANFQYILGDPCHLHSSINIYISLYGNVWTFSMTYYTFKYQLQCTTAWTACAHFNAYLNNQWW